MTETTNDTLANHGVQAGQINGDISIIGTGVGREDLVVRIATKAEREEVRDVFVAPGGFHEARSLLPPAAGGAMVLCGRGSGRSYTARKILVSRGAATVAHLNPERSLGSVRESELTAGHGYVWDLREAGGQPFTDHGFTHCAGLMRAMGCDLVVLLDHPAASCPAAEAVTTTLTPPNALEVAVAAVERSGSEQVEDAVSLLKSDFRDVLTTELPPSRAISAAGLALRVVAGKLTSEDALRDLREGADVAVAAWFAAADPRARTLAVAVALLENEPVDEVMRFADMLDALVKRAELPEGVEPEPTKVFHESKRGLIEAIRAVMVERDHPVHAGLIEHTVRFERHDWADAVLRHVWAEYPVAHALVEQWMAAKDLFTGFWEPIRRGLCVFIAQVPAHDPLRPLRALARQRQLRAQDLAAATLASLADDHKLGPLVDQTLEQWSEGRVGERSAAALYWATPVGRRDVDQAVAALTALARDSTSAVVHGAVIASTMRLLRHPALRPRVVGTVVEWSAAGSRRGGRRRAAMALVFYLIGFADAEWFDGDEVRAQFPEQVRLLLARTLPDPEFGWELLTELIALGDDVRLGRKGSREELLRVMSLITDDLGWRSRTRLLRRLSAPHPKLRGQLRTLLRLAAKTAKRS
ncbi:hypothetical protein [Actinokineospora pegani]|uniref:hypothetical protein n=1 Tax=Actinokineospora pegani TaxID=2654637 RepID=UPI0012EAC56B|nr:hypothetical protein [Actinokineospora pegani]